MTNGQSARQSFFDTHPEIYERARPLYPPALLDDLFTYLGDPPAARIIEIGPGTGQLTGALLERGARVTAVELGENLAEFLAAKFATNPALEVVQGAFEEVPLPEQEWDLVTAATAFHWVDRAVRFTKPQRLLVPGGALAIIDTNQVRDEVDNGFFDRTYPVYLRYRPNERYDSGNPPDLVPPIFEDLRTSGRFEDVQLFRYRWDQTYTPETYRDLLLSYSDTHKMVLGAREGLISDLCAMVAEEPGGTVTRPLVITLVAGRALPVGKTGAR